MPDTDDDVNDREYMQPGYTANGYVYSGQVDVPQIPCPCCKLVECVVPLPDGMYVCLRHGIRYSAIPVD